MEERKQKEIEHYDKKAEEWMENKNWEGDFEGFNPMSLPSFSFLYKKIKEFCSNKKLLDFGCGNGIHSIFPAKCGAEVVGIDLSEKSLKIARKKAEKENVQEKTEFLKMDCENLEFEDNSFDVVLDGGAFSSLDLNKVFPEIKRVLKKDGKLIGIETFGHNPFINFKRKLNKAKGKRTEWAESHIFNQESLKLAKEYFNKTEVYYFHTISWIAIPFLKFPGGKILLKFFEAIDNILNIIPLFKKWSFKVVFIFSNPK
jgi:ubiquinone/menaquinone biosynthesis C-methylase UbiE